MKVQVIVSAVANSDISLPSLGLGTLMALLDRDDEITLTGGDCRDHISSDVDVVVIHIGEQVIRGCNLAEWYRRSGAHVVLIGIGANYFETEKNGQTVFVGPAAEIWPAFLRDWRCGHPGRCYASEFTLAEAVFADPLQAA